MQIANQVKYLVASGWLAPGEKVLPIRVLAHQLLVNPNPVARASLELEQAGVGRKRHGAGTYFSNNGSPLAHKKRVKILSQRVDALLAEAAHMQVGPEDLIKLIKDRHQSMQMEKNK